MKNTVSISKKAGRRIKAAVSVLLAMVLAVTALSVGFAMPSAAQVSAGEEGSAKVLATNIDSELSVLKANIKNYEDMMDGEHIYKNMDAAYTAYCNACEAYYENYYGYEYDDGSTVHEQDVTEVTTANTALETAMENMEEFKGYEGEATTAADGSYTSDSSKATSSTPLLMQKSDTTTTYTTDCNTNYGTKSGIEVKAMGDGHDSIEMYDELSGVMYTYGVNTGAGSYGANPTTGGTGSNQRLGGQEMNNGLIYGSVVFLYTGEGKGKDEYFNRTSTYAVPIDCYLNFYPSYKDQTTISYLGVNFDDEANAATQMNGGAFELHRGWHGWYANSANTFNSQYVSGISGSSNNYENHFFGFNEGFAYKSGTYSFYSQIYIEDYDSSYGYSKSNWNGGLLYRSYNTGNNHGSSINSNTLYYTGDPKTSVANKDTTKIAGNSTSTATGTGTYYAQYDTLDFIYFNNIGGDSSAGAGAPRRRGTRGFHALIRYNRNDPYNSDDDGKVEYYLSNDDNDISSTEGKTVGDFVTAVQNYELNDDISGFAVVSKTSRTSSSHTARKDHDEATQNTKYDSAQPGGNADSYIYVVDYEPVLEELDEDMGYLNIRNNGYYYRYGSTNMHNILKAFDTITAYNPNSAFSSNSTSSTTLNVATTVEAVANNLKSYTSSLDSAISSNVSSGNVKGYDTVSYTVYDMALTGYDEATGESGKTNFLNSNAFVTSGTTVGYYTLLSNYVAPTKLATYQYNVPGTVGEYTASHALPTSELPTGYEWSSDVNSAYYAATTGAQESIEGGFLHTVTSSLSDSTATMLAYAANVELYTFATPKDIQIRFRYRDQTAGDGAIIKYDEEEYTAHSIEYYKTTFEDVYPQSFVYGGIKYVLSSRGVGSGNLTYTITDDDITFTWDSSHAGGQYEFSIYYEEVPVNVVYTSYSVTLEENTNKINGDASQVDGYVQLNGSTAGPSEQVSESPTAAYDTKLEASTNPEVTVAGPVGATAVPNTNTANGQKATFVRWYLLDKDPDSVTWQNFANATSVTGSWDAYEHVPNLVTDLTQAGITDAKYNIENWSTDSANPTTFYYYALFTAEEPDMSTKHLQVTLVMEDWQDNSSVEAGTQFIINVTDKTTSGTDMDISYVAEIGEDGTVTLTFDVLPGDCVVEINTDFAYGYSLVIDPTDEHNVGDGTQTETINTGTEDNHHLTFYLVYDPLNTAESNSDSKTNNFTYGSTEEEPG